MDIIIGYGIGILAIYIVAKLLSVPIRIISRLIFNGIAGGITLLLVNFVGEIFGITVAINALSALIAGFFGIPGVVLLIFLNNA
ncbi:sigmaK-factor processing regulatory protein BofA [Andreesenia angusta]|uniref:SigmaK-factor processing regulatory protein BofA n=1 Tax=Andreesenia angusta TaxID=39480 RepID=A0A1S1V483_9FIRM|nr:pro-sigmaK processing inhibitor BofA family protein [Andreesenia angusta]OHW61516.1 sigmaK-factor processing regulatory protein BofA [Andreesenia angusta]